MALMAVSHDLLLCAIFVIQMYERRAGPNPFAERRWQLPTSAYALIAGLVLVAGFA
jgi:hypothetical protein